MRSERRSRFPTGPGVRAWSTLASVGLVLLLGFSSGPGCGGDDRLLLPNPSNVTGTTGALRGTVRSGGLPVDAVDLRTVPGGPTARTDALGRYTLEAVVPGQVRVVAERSGFLPSFEDVVVLPGRTSVADVSLVPASLSGTLRGQVTDGSFGLSGVEVRTVPASQTLVTGVDGRYSFAGLTPGSYTVRVRRLGYDSVERTLPVLEGRETVQDFALAARTDGVVQGRVTDSGGALLPGVRVDLLAGNTVVTAITNQLGEFGFFGVTTGFYLLSSSRAGFLPGSKGIDVRGGAVANGDLVMFLVTNPSPVPGAITGTVYDGDDRPVAGITVSPSVAATPPTTVTAADGRFRFVDVPTGSVVVTATQVAPLPGQPTFATGTRTVLVGSGATADASLNLEEI